MSRTIRADDIRTGRARFVRKGRYYTVEWAPKGSQLRIPMPKQGRTA